MAKGGGFQDSFEDLSKEASGMSDAELERLMMTGGPIARDRGPAASQALAPGSRVDGVVIDFRGGELLVELDGKTSGVISEVEFSGALPLIGDRLQAQFERFDKKRGLAILSVGGVRREILWEELRRGNIVEGTVTAVNKGGLTLDLKGLRAFLPASQVARERIEDLSSFIGQKLRCEVTDVDRAAKNIVLSRRMILERELEAEKVNVLARLSEGEVLKGTVVRVNDYGAFIDLGGVDGLIPASKIHAQVKSRAIDGPLKEGQQVTVQVIRVDQEKGRVSLDLKQLAADTWKRAIEGYAVGEEVTGWVSKVGPTEVTLSIEEGLDGVIPEGYIHLLGDEGRPGAILKAAVTSIDAEKRRILLRPVSQAGTDSKKA